MHDQIAVGRRHFAAMPGDDRIERRLLRDFSVRQDRIELLSIQIVVDDLMPRRRQFIDGRRRDRVAETSGVLMADDDKDVHFLTTFSPQ